MAMKTPRTNIGSSSLAATSPTPLGDVSFVAVDVEGNGASPPEIIEIALVPFSGRQFAAPLQSLVRPEKPISAIVERKHGISNDDVRHAPRFEELAEQVRATLAGRVLVGHRAMVEVSLLSKALGDWRPTSVVDTFDLARRLLPELASYSLASIAQTLGLRADSPLHRALPDADLAARVMISLADTAGIRTLEPLLHLASPPTLLQQRSSEQLALD